MYVAGYVKLVMKLQREVLNFGIPNSPVITSCFLNTAKMFLLFW